MDFLRLFARLKWNSNSYRKTRKRPPRFGAHFNFVKAMETGEIFVNCPKLCGISKFVRFPFVVVVVTSNVRPRRISAFCVAVCVAYYCAMRALRTIATQRHCPVDLPPPPPSRTLHPPLLSGSSPLSLEQVNSYLGLQVEPSWSVRCILHFS